VILVNYVGYLISEMVGLSGIMALFVSGVGTKLYVSGNLTPES
jgi:NhaP-type Na+/H+ or K+/H+ antiporter